MSKKIKIASVRAGGFWRCGRHFTKTGTVAQVSDFTEADLERLKNEPLLRVTDAGPDDEQAVEERAETIAEAIKTLTAEDFQKDGKPKLDALKSLVGDELGKISTAERDAVWDNLTGGGFTAPAAG
ncbi:hypothetical protein [Leisingera sp. MMG026]|uniref:hypothetical protein n=1 Tax=Leisingera sp. MMG026 TaxID=2909982 RepID=UPI001F1CE145|nr:hypothetical protein [Leisingera sp. MMG026]MCF6432915.1 hypothetical protein [Leisingera sp. MMG026]